MIRMGGYMRHPCYCEKCAKVFWSPDDKSKICHNCSEYKLVEE